jgi:hypothetical protein
MGGIKKFRKKEGCYNWKFMEGRYRKNKFKDKFMERACVIFN